MLNQVLTNGTRYCGATWIFVLGWDLVLDDGTYLFSKKCSLLQVMLPLYSAQVLDYLSIGRHLLYDVQ